MAITVTQAFKDAQKGAVDRTQTKVEVYLSGALGWVDITEWVEEWTATLEESPAGGRASANTLNLSLINDDGRFSPDNTAGPYTGNLVPNKPIHVSTYYGSESVREFTGFVSNWIPSAASRICQVTAEDTARILARKDIVEETVFDPVAPATGYYLTRVLERAAYLSGLRWDAVTTRAAAWTNLDQDGNGFNEIAGTYNGAATRAVYTLAGALVMTLDLVDLYLPVSPLKGKCLAVLQQIADVAGGVVTFDAQGQLVFRSRMYRNDSTLASVETFTTDNVDDLTAQTNYEDAKFAQLVNRAVVRSTPWAFKTDSSGAVIEEEVDFKGDLFAKYFFNAGERYPDYVADPSAADLYCELPSGINLFKTSTYPAASNMILRSVDNSDPTKETNGIAFQAGYPIFEQGRVKLAFINNGSAAERISSLKIKAKLMRPIQRCQSIQRNDDSIVLYDQRDKEIANDLIPNAGACKNLAAWTVEDGRTPKKVYTIRLMHGCSWLELGDKITVSETVTNSVPVATDVIVRRKITRWTLAAVMVTIEACSPSPDFTAGSIPATVTNVETLNMDHLGDKAGDKPFTIVDKATQLVGLNNVPAFRNLIESSLALSYTQTMTLDVCMGGGYLWTVGYGGDVTQINPQNGNELGTAVTNAANRVRRCDWINSRLWVLETDSSDANPILKSVDASRTVRTKHTFASGATFDGYYSDVLGINHSGTPMLFVLIGKAGGGCELRKWTDLSDTAGAAAATYTVSAAPWNPVEMVYDGKYLYVSQLNISGSGSKGQISRVDPATGTVTTAITLASEYAYSVATDGAFLYVSTETGGIPVVDRVRKYAIQQGATAFTLLGTLTLDQPTGLLFDGLYLWCVNRALSWQVDPATLLVIAKYPSGYSSNGLALRSCFDGLAVWLTTEDSKLIRVPKIPVSR